MPSTVPNRSPSWPGSISRWAGRRCLRRAKSDAVQETPKLLEVNLAGLRVGLAALKHHCLEPLAVLSSHESNRPSLAILCGYALGVEVVKAVRRVQGDDRTGADNFMSRGKTLPPGIESRLQIVAPQLKPFELDVRGGSRAGVGRHQQNLPVLINKPPAQRELEQEIIGLSVGLSVVLRWKCWRERQKQDHHGELFHAEMSFLEPENGINSTLTRLFGMVEIVSVERL